MAEAKPSPSPRREDTPASARDEDAPRHRDASCNLPGCEITDDLTRGLCPVHWSTHRGLADPEPTEPKEFGQVPHPEVALP